jgi:hypothetical protein
MWQEHFGWQDVYSLMGVSCDFTGGDEGEDDSDIDGADEDEPG